MFVKNHVNSHVLFPIIESVIRLNKKKINVTEIIKQPKFNKITMFIKVHH